MQYFNAVLRPPHELANALTLFAQENFSEVSDGCCLSNKVFPHITLCQFRANEMPNVSFGAINKVPEPMTYNVRIGEGIHEGLSLIHI